MEVFNRRRVGSDRWYRAGKAVLLEANGNK
jgi:hypothetical protein